MDDSDWIAPPADGGILLSPGRREMIAAALANNRSLNRCETIIDGQPLRIWRQRMREILGYADPKQILICSGHQAELYHPGVWIKLALIDRLAKETGGRAVHIAVDSDEPKHLQLRWPGGGIPISQQIDGVAWAGRLPTPSQEHLRQVNGELKRAKQKWNFEPMASKFLQLLMDASEPNLPTAITHAMQKLDQEIGLSYDVAMSETIWASEPYVAFVTHILNHAEEFASCYNNALAEYRRENRIKSPGRPMPDLSIDPDKIELPFWLDDLTTGRRERLTILRNEKANRLDQFRSGNIRLAPRALTLTMFIRLFLADQWIHGIGGARYDQVTNHIVEQFFHVTSPAFGVTTATLYFPSVINRHRTDLPALAHAGHQLKHRVLGPSKQPYLDKIVSAPHRSAERMNTFTQMHRAMDKTESPDVTHWNQTWNQAQQTANEDRAIFDRELFYALQPRERLVKLLNSSD